MTELNNLPALFLHAHAINQLMAGAILTLFLLMVVLIWRIDRRLHRSISVANRLLRTIDRNSGGLPEMKQRIEEHFLANSVLSHGWHEYSETLVIEGRVGDQQFRSTKPAEDFFNYDTLIHSTHWPFGIKQGIFEALPSILTGLGLLGTFLGLVVGLPGNMQSTKEIAESVPKFMGGMRGAFLSSVLGVATGLAINIYEKFVADRRQQECKRLSDLIDKAFLRRPEHYFLEELAAVAREQLTEYRHLAVQIGNEVVRGLTGTAAQAVNVDDNIKKGIAMGFDVLARSLSEFSEFQAQYFANVKEASALQASILAGFKEITGSSETAVKVIHGATENVMGLSRQLQESSATLQIAASDMGAIAEKQSTTMSALKEAVGTAGTSATELVSRQNMFLSALQETTGRFATSNATLNQQIANYHDKLKASLKEDFATFDAELARGIDRFGSAISMLNTYTESLGQMVANIERTNKELASHLSVQQEQQT